MARDAGPQPNAIWYSGGTSSTFEGERSGLQSILSLTTLEQADPNESDNIRNTMKKFLIVPTLLDNYFLVVQLYY